MTGLAALGGDEIGKIDQVAAPLRIARHFSGRDSQPAPGDGRGDECDAAIDRGDLNRCRRFRCRPVMSMRMCQVGPGNHCAGGGRAVTGHFMRHRQREHFLSCRAMRRVTGNRSRESLKCRTRVGHELVVRVVQVRSMNGTPTKPSRKAGRWKS